MSFKPIAFGYSSEKGNRPSQQDDFLIQENVFGDDTHHLYAVFDGHGVQGDKVSGTVKQLFKEIFPRHKDAFLSDPKQTLIDVFYKVSELLESDSEIDTYMSGTTAAVAILTPLRIIVANLGDCRVILAQAKKMHPGTDGGPPKISRPKVLSNDHTCACPAEKSRLEASGARIAKNPQDADVLDAPLRVYKGSMPYPGLVTTRAFGDSSAHKIGIICEPEVIIQAISPKDKYIILGTDGVWDALSNNKVAFLVSDIPDASEASQELAKKSLKYLDKKGIDDNTTNIVVFIDWQIDSSS